MLNFDLITNFIDPKFKVKAIAQYLEKKQSYYDSIMRISTELIGEITVGDDDVSLAPENLEGRINNALESAGIAPSAKFYFQEGYINSVQDLISFIVRSQVSAENMGNDIENFSIPTILPSGTEGASYTVTRIFDEMKETLKSLICTIGAIRAYDSDELSQRYVIMNDYVGRFFDGVDSMFSTSVSYFKDLIRANPSVNDFMSALRSVTSMYALAVDNTGFLPAMSDITSITGASPVCAISFSPIETIGAVLNIGFKVADGIFSGLLSMAGASVTNMVKGISQIYNPIDLTVIDGEAPTIDKFYYSGEEAAAAIRVYSEEEIPIDFLYQVDDLVNKWIKIDLIPGEVLFKLNLVNRTNITNPNYKTLSVYYEWVLKPKPVRDEYLYAALNTIGRSVEGEVDAYGVFIGSVIGLTEVASYSNPYYDNIEDEVGMIRAFTNGLLLFKIITCAQGKLLSLPDEAADYPDYRIAYASPLNIDTIETMKDTIFPYSSLTVTNANYLGVAAGYFSNMWNKYGEFDNVNVGSTSSSSTIGLTMDPIVACFISHLLDEYQHPTSFKFLPYSNNTSGFSTSKYQIKTDEENKEAFRSFWTTAINVVITASVLAGGLAVAKKVSRDIASKRARTINAAVQKSLNGEELTKKEAKLINKITTRSNTLSTIMSGFAGSGANTSESLSSVTRCLNSILSLIR